MSRRTSAISCALDAIISARVVSMSPRPRPRAQEGGESGEGRAGLERLAAPDELHVQRPLEIGHAAGPHQLFRQLGAARHLVAGQHVERQSHPIEPEAVQQARPLVRGQLDGGVGRGEAVGGQGQLDGIGGVRRHQRGELAELLLPQRRPRLGHQAGHRDDRPAQLADAGIVPVAGRHPAAESMASRRHEPISSARDSTPTALTGVLLASSSSWNASRKRTSVLCRWRTR